MEAAYYPPIQREGGKEGEGERGGERGIERACKKGRGARTDFESKYILVNLLNGRLKRKERLKRRILGNE